MLELTMNDILYMIKGALTGQIGEIQIYAKSKCDISFVYTFHKNTLIVEMEDSSEEVEETITVSCIELSDIYIYSIFIRQRYFGFNSIGCKQ